MKRFSLAVVSGLLVGGALFAKVGDGSPGPTGSISGSVRVRNVPSLAPLVVNNDAGICGERLPSEEVVATADGRLRYVVVSLKGAFQTPEPKRKPMVLRNTNCAFEPHVQSGTTGSGLVASNRDPMLHNVRLVLRMGDRSRSMLNLALPGASGVVNASRATRFPGVLEVRCDAHKWMSAYILLFDHPYHAVTAADGSFTIPDVPAGKYLVRVWHERLGELEAPVVVEPGRTARLELVYEGG